MTTKQKFRSDVFEAIHSTAAGMHRAGAIDKTTMREFDEMCLAAPAAITPTHAASRTDRASLRR